VGLADYDIWTAQFGSRVDELAVGAGNADGNGDGVIDLADYTVWRDTLGATGIEMAMGQALVSVPEPASRPWTEPLRRGPKGHPPTNGGEFANRRGGEPAVTNRFRTLPRFTWSRSRQT